MTTPASPASSAPASSSAAASPAAPAAPAAALSRGAIGPGSPWLGGASAPALLRWPAVLIAWFCALSPLGGGFIAFNEQRWYMLAFEVVVFLTASTALATNLRRGRGGQAMCMFVLGGVVGSAAVLSEPSIATRLIQGGSGSGAATGFDVLPWALARIACGLVLVGLACLTVLSRRPRTSLLLLAKGAGLGLPVLAAAALFLIPSARTQILNLPLIPSVLLVIFGSAVAGVLISLSAHCLIRAFEVGVDAGNEPGAGHVATASA